MVSPSRFSVSLIHLPSKVKLLSVQIPASYLCWNTHVGKVTGCYVGRISNTFSFIKFEALIPFKLYVSFYFSKKNIRADGGHVLRFQVLRGVGRSYGPLPLRLMGGGSFVTAKLDPLPFLWGTFISVHQQRCHTRDESQGTYIMYASTKVWIRVPTPDFKSRGASPKQGRVAPKMDMCPSKTF